MVIFVDKKVFQIKTDGTSTYGGPHKVFTIISADIVGKRLHSIGRRCIIVKEEFQQPGRLLESEE